MTESKHILEPDEQVVFKTRTHKWVFLAPVSFVIITLLVLPDFVLAFLFFGILFFTGILQYNYSEYLITNKRFIKKSGFFYIRTEEIPVEKINNVTFWQGWSDRVLGTGIVTLFGMGISTKRIKGLARAKDFRNALHSQLSVEPENYFD
jgi:uncharacterized membrane protein YdbT with pleckstrin-like domain